METWKKIDEYDGYEISNLGNVRSLDRYVLSKDKSKPNLKKGKMLKLLPLKLGYLAIDLCKDGVVKKYSVHRLVAKYFIDNVDNKPFVNHINGVKSDNRVENLEWCTSSENQLHSIRIGLRHTRGENNSQCKINEEVVLKILNDNRIYKEISKDYNISVETVCDIKKGRSWTHITGLPNLKKIKLALK